MTNQRRPEHMSPRVADPEEKRAGLRGAPGKCEVPECEGAVDGGAALCGPHWLALPWALRNDTGNGWRPPQRAGLSASWLARAVRLLTDGPRTSWYASTPLSREEKRARPWALRVLEEYDRPDPGCNGGQHPCPYVSCRFHLYLSVNDEGTLQIDHPGKEPWELEDTCALDVAARGGLSAAEAGARVGLGRARVRQIEQGFRAALWAAGVTRD